MSSQLGWEWHLLVDLCAYFILEAVEVLLINPPVSLEERYGSKMKSFGAVAEPLGLAFVAAFLEKYGYPVRILDAAVLQVSLERIRQFLSHHYFDVVGVTMLTTTYSTAKRTLEVIKEASPSTLTVCGGPHPTALPGETLREIEALDLACIGEGEWTMYEIVRALEEGNSLSQVQGIAYREDGEVVRTEPRPFERDLDTFPIPARHLLPIRRYSLTASRTSGGGYCPTIIIARGCPFRCAFCFKVFGRGFRHHSIRRIIEELELLVEKYHVSQVNLEADTISIDKQFLSDLCDAIVKKGLHKRIRWTCESRVNTVDKDVLEKMRGAGCWQISYGVESGTQRLLDIIQKDITLEQVARVFNLTKKCGISIRAFFMLGLPTETREESLRTIEFAKRLDTKWAQFTLTTPYPGTPLYALAEANGELRSKDWDDYNTWGGWKGGRLSYVTTGRTEEELRQLQKLAFYKFYMRPKIFFRFLRDALRSPGDFTKLVSGFWVLLLLRLRGSRK